MYVLNTHPWTSLAVQGLKLCTYTAGGTGSIPGHRSSTCRRMQPKIKYTSLTDTQDWTLLRALTQLRASEFFHRKLGQLQAPSALSGAVGEMDRWLLSLKGKSTAKGASGFRNPACPSPLLLQRTSPTTGISALFPSHSAGFFLMFDFNLYFSGFAFKVLQKPTDIKCESGSNSV